MSRAFPLLALLLFSCSKAPSLESMAWEGDTLTLGGHEIGRKIPDGFLLEWPPGSGELEQWLSGPTHEDFLRVALGLYSGKDSFNPGE